MLVVYADSTFREHATPEGHPERPERYDAVLGGISGAREIARVEGATKGDLADVKRVHDPAYVTALAARATTKTGVSLDADTWLSPRSFEVALQATGTIVAATDAALRATASDDPARRAFAVLRPPGHHARPASAMGFCLFNNIAVAAARARAVHGLDRVAIIDFDVHHGNGTQEMFWEDGAVLFASLHRERFYPGTGTKDETGRGAGLGATINVPLAASTPPSKYKDAFDRVMDVTLAFRPQLLLVSAGFDAYHDDPVGGLGLSSEHYRWLGERLRSVADDACEGRVVAALEGGYALDALGDLANAFVSGLGR